MPGLSGGSGSNSGKRNKGGGGSGGGCGVGSSGGSGASASLTGAMQTKQLAEMTAIQRAEARARAAAAEAEAKAKIAKEDKIRAKQQAPAKGKAHEAVAVKGQADRQAKAKAEQQQAHEAQASGAVQADAADVANTESNLPSDDKVTASQTLEGVTVGAMASVDISDSQGEMAPKSVHGIKDADTDAEGEGSLISRGKIHRERTDTREHLNLVFIGHVDAGKSTFCGQILYQTDQVDARTIEKYEKEAKEKNRDSWFLAFIMDTNEEERAKGKTVEVGRAHFDSPSKRYTILDAPGHKNYVPSMIAGACQADVGVLVISARKGEFETGFERGGQTREHALLAKTLGVRMLILAINKMDDSTVEWSQERFEECRDKLMPFLKGCGYNPKKDIAAIPVSAYTGHNIIEPVGEGAVWYDGPTFLACLDALPALDRNRDAPLRLPILSKYKDLGTVIEGKVEQGTISVGDKLYVMPNRKPVEVLNVWLDQDEVPYLVGGENARVRLKDISDEEIQPGYVLSSRKAMCASVKKFEAQMHVVELLEHKSIFSAGYTAVLHVHASAEECNIGRLTSIIDRKTGGRSKKPPMFVKSGAVITCVVEVEQAVCIEEFDKCPQLGRFTLRDEGKTIAVGKCLKLMEESE